MLNNTALTSLTYAAPNVKAIRQLERSGEYRDGDGGVVGKDVTELRA